MEKGGEDRISTLPDCLLIEILSRLPCTNDAIRTGTISKRWKHLWTWVPTLIFSSVVDNRRPWSRSDYIQFVDKTLTQCRQLKLKKFVVCTGYESRFESQFHNWIRYAISCNVEEVKLTLWNTTLKSAFQLDQIFYISSCFTHLRLTGCMFSPNGEISWKNLRNLCISHANLSEDVIENILSGSPVLETLVLEYCYGYNLLTINSKSVKNLVFSGYYDPEVAYDDVDNIIAINAPNILSLAIQKALVLWKILLINVSSLVEAELDYKKRGHCHKETEEETLKGFIVNLRHVKELKIGGSCSKVAARLEAKGFAFPSNIKFVERRN